MTGPEMSDLLDALGVDLPDELLTLALTHRSYAYETRRPAHQRAPGISR